MKPIENIMDKLEEYLRDRTLLLVASVEDENFEFSQILKDEIDKKINDISKFLIENKYTTLDHQSVVYQLEKRKNYHMTEWYDILEIDSGKRAYFD